MPNRVESSSEDEWEATQSQSQRGTTLSPEDKERFVGLFCSYMLVAECKKVPVKKSDILKAVMKDYGRHFNVVLDAASAMLERVYGYRIVELKKNLFILTNNLDGVTAANDEPLWSTVDDTEATTLALLTVMLTGIFMYGEKMPEGTMRDYLKKLGVDIESKEHHPIFGNVNKLIHQDLVKQCYLDITLDKTVDPAIREYRWGERATLQVSKKDILELACKIHGNNTRPEMWIQQWKAAQDSTGENTNDN